MKAIVNEYLEKVGAKSVEELSDSQIERFYSSEHKGSPLEWAYLTACSGIESGGFTKSQVIESMRKSMEQGVMLECGYVMNETADGSVFTPNQTGWIIKP